MTIAAVSDGRALSRNCETLICSVGDPDGDEARFAATLAAALKTTNSRLRLKIAPDTDNAKALARAWGMMI